MQQSVLTTELLWTFLVLSGFNNVLNFISSDIVKHAFLLINKKTVCWNTLDYHFNKIQYIVSPTAVLTVLSRLFLYPVIHLNKKESFNISYAIIDTEDAIKTCSELFM